MSLEVAFEIGRLWPLIKVISDTLQSSQDKIFLELPGLVAWYPGGPTTNSGKVVNRASSLYDLGRVGLGVIGYDGHPYVTTGNGTNYYFLSGFPSCLGTEGYIDPAIRGLTIGGWLKADGVTGTNGGIVVRDILSPNRGWGLTLNDASGEIRFLVSGNGGAAFTVNGEVAPVGDWVFVAGRYTPSTEIAVWVGGRKNTSATTIPSSLHDTTANFEIGRQFEDNTQMLDGQIRDVFVCQAALTDETIAEIRATSAP